MLPGSQYSRLPSQTSLPPQYELHERRDPSKSDSAAEPLRVRDDDEHEPSHGSPAESSRFAKRFSGWRFGVACSAILMFSVFIINLSFTLWAISNHETHGGIGTLQEGSCAQTKTLSTWLHLAINILGTAMLSGSNYCMQRLCAPTRKELDRAHRQKFYLDIGIVSVRNLAKISKRRLGIWLLLALSSVPLHLLYNSAVFAQTTVSAYNVFVGREDFLQGASFDSRHSDNTYISYPDEEIYWLRNNTDRLHRLEVDECIDAYANAQPSLRSDVILVSSSTADNNGSLLADFAFDPGKLDPTMWLCAKYDGSCTGRKAKAQKPWTVSGFEIAYCMSLTIEEKCELRFSVGILSIVIICNFIKALCTLLTVWKMDYPTLVTIGDAISSFLQQPDRATVHFKPNAWVPKRRHWFSAASFGRWVSSNLLCLVGLIVVVVLLRRGLVDLDDRGIGTSLRGLRALGFGQPSSNVTISTGATLSLWAIVLIANVPQFILSLLYLSYNNIYTCQLIAHEWSQFSQSRKRLRVTKPLRGQVSTYYLGLPYAYGIPLLIMSVLLHWMFSRSIFLVNMSFVDYLGRSSKTDDITECGYSPIAIIYSVALSCVVLLAGILNGFRRYAPGTRLVGSRSTAISAACHPNPDEIPDLAFKPLQYGIVSYVGDQAHCSFSSRPVERPGDSDLYQRNVYSFQ